MIHDDHDEILFQLISMFSLELDDIYDVQVVDSIDVDYTERLCFRSMCLVVDGDNDEQ